jgi:hypothetical protein
MNVLTGINNLLIFINDNWALIASIITLVLVIAKKFISYFSLPKEKQLEIAKAQISQIMLRLVTEAECDYHEWVKAGSIKRSQVIDEVFAMYPILSQVTNQEEVIVWIDEEINKALKEMRKIFEENVAGCQSPELEG